MAHQNYDDSEGVWRTVGGRRIFIRNGQSLTDAMKESGKFKVTAEGDVEEDYDITEQWLLRVNPGEGDIEIADYVIGADGKKYTDEDATLDDPTKGDKEVGNWFKHTIWGKCKLQKSIKNPSYVKSADIILLEDCPLFREQTVEIKQLKGTQRFDGIKRRIKSGIGQSENVLLDITGTLLNKEKVINESYKYFVSHDWLKTLVIKEEDEVKRVYSK